MYSRYQLSFDILGISAFSNISIDLDQNYEEKALGTIILFSIIAFALTLFTAIAIKKARPLGIVTAIAQPLGFYASMKFLLGFVQIDFSKLEITVTSNISMEHARELLNERISQIFQEEITPHIVEILPWALVLLAAFALTLVYAALLSKEGRGNGLAVTAAGITIFQFFFVPPFNYFAAIPGLGTNDMQVSWDGGHRFFRLLPLIFLAIQGIVVLVANAKAKNAPAVPESAPVAPATEEIPAEQPSETPASEESTEAPATEETRE